MTEAPFTLQGRVAVITGGSSGIGRAIARRFQRAGAHVLVADRVPPEDEVPYVAVDVARESDLAAALVEAIRCWGKVDILVNNAGIQPLGVRFADLTAELLERTFAVNAGSVALGIKQAGLRLADGGRVINLASFVAKIGAPGTTAYAASKAAVVQLTRAGAIELAPRGITVNAISPGTIRTPAVTSIPNNPEIPFIERRTPLGRLGEPDEVAGLCQYLASADAGYITGQNIGIDGGLTAGWTEYAVVPPAMVQKGQWRDDP